LDPDADFGSFLEAHQWTEQKLGDHWSEISSACISF
jgi:hypothetical protein